MSDENPTGIDVSHYQGNVDWAEVKAAGTTFAAIKATQYASGYEYQDYYPQQIQSARASGLVVGGYHMLTGYDNGKTQGEYFLSVAKPQKGDLIPMLDMEQASGGTPEQVVAAAKAWMDVVEQAVGKKPFIYTNTPYWEEIGNPTGFEDNPLWIAEYGVSSPKLPATWTLYTIWQHSQSGTVSGIDGDVDLDIFNAPLDVLKDFQID